MQKIFDSMEHKVMSKGSHLKVGIPKRAVDHLRDGAGSMSMDVPGDDSEVTGMLTFADRLMVVKRRGIYEIKMADEIDPNRTNLKAPNTLQRLSPFGSDEVFVGKILLTAYRLLQKDQLKSDIDCDAAMLHAGEIVRNVAEMRLLSDRFRAEQDEAIANFEQTIGKNRSIVLPSIVNVDIRLREFIQKADHALQKLFDIAQLFYSDLGKGGWTSLKARIEGEHRVDNFDNFLRSATPYLLQIRNARNAVEHEHRDMKLVAADFTITSNNSLFPPLVEFIHPKTAFSKTPIKDFMSSTCANIVDIVEMMLVFLCARHIQSKGSLAVHMIEVPEDRRTSPNVRFGYGIMIDGEMVPLS